MKILRGDLYLVFEVIAPEGSVSEVGVSGSGRLADGTPVSCPRLIESGTKVMNKIHSGLIPMRADGTFLYIDESEFYIQCGPTNLEIRVYVYYDFHFDPPLPAGSTIDTGFDFTLNIPQFTPGEWINLGHGRAYIVDMPDEVEEQLPEARVVNVNPEVFLDETLVDDATYYKTNLISRLQSRSYTALDSISKVDYPFYFVSNIDGVFCNMVAFNEDNTNETYPISVGNNNLRIDVSEASDEDYVLVKLQILICRE